jgi:hypothetical protein
MRLVAAPPFWLATAPSPRTDASRFFLLSLVIRLSAAAGRLGAPAPLLLPAREVPVKKVAASSGREPLAKQRNNRPAPPSTPFRRATTCACAPISKAMRLMAPLSGLLQRPRLGLMRLGFFLLGLVSFIGLSATSILPPPECPWCLAPGGTAAARRGAVLPPLPISMPMHVPLMETAYDRHASTH